MATEYLYINTRDELLRLECSKIVYFEGDGNYTKIFFVKGEYETICKNLSETEKIISESTGVNTSIFTRVGKRYIVNLNFVYQINILKQTLVLTDMSCFSTVLKISKDALKKLKTAILERTESPTNDTNA